MGPLQTKGEAWKGGLQGHTSPYPLSSSVPPRMGPVRGTQYHNFGCTDVLQTWIEILLFNIATDPFEGKFDIYNCQYFNMWSKTDMALSTFS